MKHTWDCKCINCQEKRNIRQRERRAKEKAQEQKEKELVMIGKQVRHRVIVKDRVEAK